MKMRKNKINKTEIISIRCTEKEKQNILHSAQKFNLSLSAYLLNRRKSHLYSTFLIKMIDNIASNDNKLENNINQIARNLNTNNCIVDSHSFQNILKSLHECAIKREQIGKQIEKLIKIISDD